MTDRPITEEDLHAYIDGRLDGQRSETVRAYLNAHPEAAETVAAYSADRQRLRDALQPIADAPIPPALDVRRMVEARRRSRAALRGLPLAASITLAVGLGGGWFL